jgi:hypothetical protein
VDEYAAAFLRLEDVMRHHDPAFVRRITAVHDLPPVDPVAYRDLHGIDDMWRGLTA